MAYSLSLEPLKAHGTDTLSQLPASGDPGGFQSDTSLRELNGDQSLVSHFQAWKISHKLHCLTLTLSPLN